MCPENMTNLEDGSYQCNVPVRPGTNLSMRYAVIVSFGVYLNGTSLEAIASKVSSALMLPKVLPLKLSKLATVLYNRTVLKASVGLCKSMFACSCTATQICLGCSLRREVPVYSAKLAALTMSKFHSLCYFAGWSKRIVYHHFAKIDWTGHSQCFQHHC